jgi:GGDEF domain-containing protein
MRAGTRTPSNTSYEFVVIANVSDEDELAALADRFEDAISAEPWSLTAQTTHVGVTVKAAMIDTASDLGLLFEQ